MTPDEELLVRSIEWTTFQDQTFQVALEQANTILRHFMSAPSFCIQAYNMR